MPIYRDANGNRYWFEAEPDPNVVRGDLRPETPEEAAAAGEAEAFSAEPVTPP